jgi:hypothetical protein
MLQPDHLFIGIAWIPQRDQRNEGSFQSCCKFEVNQSFLLYRKALFGVNRLF